VWTDRQTDTLKLIGTFCENANVPKKPTQPPIPSVLWVLSLEVKKMD
jgi:hypothetical protein